MLKWLLILLTVSASSTGDILCAKGMSGGRELNRELSSLQPSALLRAIEYIVTRKLVIVGWCCYAVAFFSLMSLLSVTQLTAAIPATALSFVIDTVGARFILHEHIPWKRWVGVACVSAGVVLATRPGPAAPALAGTARTNCAAVQSCENQAGHH